MSLESDEKKQLEEQFRREMEDQHARRLEKLEKSRARVRARDAEAKRSEKQIAMTELKEQVRDDFYKEHGYRLYVDSTGREVWLTPEEYEIRMRRRHGRPTQIAPSVAVQRRTWILYGTVVVLAVLLGIVLAG